MKQRITIVEVAKKSGVAVSTVSRVLNGGYASPTVRARVQQVVRQMGYVPSTSARGLKLGRTGLIGFTSWHVHGGWSMALLEGVEEELSGRPESVVVSCLGLRGVHDPTAVKAWVAERRIDGLVFARPMERDRELLELLRQASVPTVVISPDDDYGYGLKLDTDNHAAGRVAAEHLVELGHRRIAFLGGPRESFDSRQRLAGLEEVLIERGIAPLTEHVGFAASYDPEASTGYAKRWLATPKSTRPTAVVLGNDELAMQFVRVLLERGVSVPADVSIVGFDGVSEAARFWPGITTVAQPMRSMGLMACRFLMRMIDGTQEVPAETMTFDVELVVRESTGPCHEVADGPDASARRVPAPAPAKRSKA